MHPVIVNFGPLAIHSYGVMLAISFLFGIWYSARRARTRDLLPTVVTDVAFYLIIAAIVGARLYYVLLHLEEFKNNPAAVFNPFIGDTVGIGGLVMLGGFIGAILVGFAYFKLNRIPFLPYADAIAPSVGFGIFFTRIGCFLNGCCYGRPTDSFWGVHFPARCPAGVYQSHIAAQQGIPMDQVALFPSQLFLSIGGLCIALLVIVTGMIARKRHWSAGVEFYLMIVLYAILRFLADFTRYYEQQRETVGALSHNQIFCVVLFVIFGGLILRTILHSTDSAADSPEPAAGPADTADDTGSDENTDT
jgi:phosphatidylglycerol:prolipoprotein diacylglycerol transferase